jgi:rubrerythrin
VSEHLTLDGVDQDGAIREAMHDTRGDTRADVLRKGLVGAGGLVAGGALLSLPALAGAATKKGGVSKTTVGILNFALTLEYLEAAFYAEAVAKGALTGPTADLAKTVAADEQAHVDFLKKALGSAAVKKPVFDFKGTTADQGMFQQTAYVLENTGVAAYSGQAPLIKEVPVVKAALSILTVEARHAGWIGALIGTPSAPPAPNAFDTPKTKAQILSAVKGTGFITG